jgi:hypothetical protein
MAGVQEMRDRSDIIIDYSINPRSIPQISALQVMDGSAGSALVG